MTIVVCVAVAKYLRFFPIRARCWSKTMDRTQRVYFHDEIYLRHCFFFAHLRRVVHLAKHTPHFPLFCSHTLFSLGLLRRIYEFSSRHSKMEKNLKPPRTRNKRPKRKNGEHPFSAHINEDALEQIFILAALDGSWRKKNYILLYK